MSTTTRPRPAPRRKGGSSHLDRKPLDNPVPGFDLLALVEQDAGPGRQSGGRFLFRCPNPQHHDNNPSFDVSFVGDRWVYNCRSLCGGGDAAEYMILTGRAFDQAGGLRVVREMSGGAAVKMAPAHPVETVEERFAPLDAPVVPDNAEEHVQRFLAERGWTQWAADTYRLTAVVGNYNQVRIRFPWLNAAGQTIFAQDRSAEAAPKYRWMSPTGKSVPSPFGLTSQAAQVLELSENLNEYETGNDLFVTEGLTDCVALTDGLQAHDPTSLTLAIGLKGGTAKLGWERYFAGSDIFIVYDNDHAGEAKRKSLRDRLTGHATSITDVYVPPPFKDVAEWRKAVGSEFPEQFIGAVAQAIEEGDR